MAKPPPSTLDNVVSLCKRRGFVYPCGEIYGGTRSAWDYGPLGVELKENIKRQWWRFMVTARDDVVGLDSSVILPTKTWEASGHLATFTDPLTECQSCHKRFRADHLQEDVAEKKGIDDPDTVDLNELVACPNCGTRGAWTEPRQFNGLLKTYLGVIEDESGLHYLRPETAQGIFLNFANVMTSSRKKPPFGIAQIGKSFRNEITPGNFIFRTREFEQMEMEFFVEPGEDEEWHQYWIDERTQWYVDLGIDPDNLRHYEHPQEKLPPLLQAHRRHRVPLRLRRLGVGRARGHRQPHRLRPDQAQQVLRPGPVVLRPGHRRALHAVRHRAGGRPDAQPDGVPGRRLRRGRGAQHQGRRRQAHRAAARPAAGAGQGRRAAAVAQRRPVAEGQGPGRRAAPADWNVDFDDAGAIGRRYRRQDEIGTPYCVTVDFDTLDDHAVTVRERDSMKQERVALDQVTAYFAERLVGC